MRVQKIAALGLLLITILIALPSAADDSSKKKLIGEIYLGHNQILDAAPPRQLSFRANVGQFEYQPGSDAIAFTSGQISGDTITYSVSLAGTQHGTITKLMSDAINLRQEAQAMGSSEEDIAKMETQIDNPLASTSILRAQNLLTLSGWSADGKYLLISQQQIVSQPAADENSPPQQVSVVTYTCANLSTSPPAQRQIALPITLQPGMDGITSEAWWSPKKTAVLFEQEASLPDAPQASQTGDAKSVADPQIVCTLYTPSTRHLSSFTLPPKVLPLGWIDEAHVMLLSLAKPRHYLSYDIATGQNTEIAKPAHFPEDQSSGTPPSATSPTNPALVLEEQPVTFPDKQQVATMSSQALWVRRTTGLKPASALPITLSLDPGPYEEWAPSGRQVAYLMHGDLFVTDLVVRPAGAYDKLALGLELNCDEQKQVGMNNLKQIGLGLMQYMQDYDEHLPPAGDVKDRVMPYIKNDDMFSVGKSQFVYHGTGQADASIASPSEFVLGTMDTPCAHIVLYGDGHVKAFDRQTGQSGANSGPCSNIPLPKIKRGVQSASALTGASR